MLRILLILTLMLSTQSAFAQQANQDTSVIKKYGPRRQISTIVYMGLAGAVLGLSTLSFYGRPQDHLTNIPLGFGVGVVIGTVYMTYQAAVYPDEFYREVSYQPDFTRQKNEIRMATDLFYEREKPNFSYRWVF